MTDSTKPKKTMVVVTPSYRPDAELCRDLNASVMKYCSPDIEHHILVPNRDLSLFADMANERTKIIGVDSLLPKNIFRIPGANLWINLARPFPPLRGWIVQQLVKLGYVASLAADLALLIDSDIVFINPVSTDSYTHDGEAPLFRRRGGVTEDMQRHVIWHQVSHRLLGLEEPGPCPLPDYITCPCLWEPKVVSALLEHIENTTGEHWATAIGRNLHFSEMMLYGVYAEHFHDQAEPLLTTDASQVHNYWDEVPLDPEGMKEFLSGVRGEHLAVMISARSNTPSEVRRQAFTEFHG